VAFRRAMKRTVQVTMDMGALGIRLRVAGRLNGADIARCENTREGAVPLHTLRANIDYGFAEAATQYGVIGVKCWICRKDPAEEEADRVKRGPRRDTRPRRPMGPRGNG
jgi:small subunit ribosomal protein S3